MRRLGQAGSGASTPASCSRDADRLGDAGDERQRASQGLPYGVARDRGGDDDRLRDHRDRRGGHEGRRL